MSPPTYQDVLDALPRVHAVLNPTLLRNWPGLSRRLGLDVWLKHENHQPVGAFKVRGGINLVGTLTEAERRAGILGVSTGNHGQSLAFAAKHFGVHCTIIVPEGNNPGKNAAIRQLGAELVEHGQNFDEAREHIPVIQQRSGARYVHSANEPALIAGVASMGYEIFKTLPDPDVILVPIGLGSSASATAIVAHHLRPQCEVIGIQCETASAVVQSIRSGDLVTDPKPQTWAEGIATGVPADLTLGIMRAQLADTLLVSNEDLRLAAALILQHTHNLAEGAGAAAVAALLRHRERFIGKRVVAILSGGNLDLRELPSILEIAQREAEG